MNDNVIQLIHDVTVEASTTPYEEDGFDGDATTAEWLLRQASRFDGAIGQAWKMRLAQGEILTQVRDRVPGFFDRWLKVHWPQMSRTTVTRLMATWMHRETLSPFIDDADCSRGNNGLPVKAVDTIAMGGAMEEVVEEVLRRLKAGEHVAPNEVADLNREAKAKRSGKPAPRRVRPTETLALNLLRKGADELTRMRQALALADRAEIVTADQVMAEQRLRHLPKGSVIHGADADFHRMKDGTWVRLPHEGMADVTAVEVEQPPEPQPQEQQTLIPEPQASPLREGVVLTRTEAAELLGINPGSFSTTVSRAKRTGQHAVIKGRRVEAVSRGMFRVI